MRQLHAAGFGCNGYLDGNEVRHDEPPEYQKQCHSHGDSPAMEHTKNFTVNDWKQLWKDFAVAFDEQVIRDKDGKTVSDNTNVSGSKSSVWLHEESKSGIPHLHAIVSRVDEDGNINTTTPSTCGHNERRKRLLCKEVGQPPCTCMRTTSPKSVPTA